MGTYTCDICGSEFNHPREKKTCSEECANVARSQSAEQQWEEQRDDMSERVKEAMQRGDVREHMRRTQLGDQNSMAGRTGEDNPAYKGKAQFECEWCGDAFEDYKSREGDRRFCSPSCRAAWQSKNMSGENAGPWKGGYTEDRDTDWPELRGRVLDKHDRRCQGCGITEQKHRVETGVGLSVHHIFPVTFFETPEDADTVENLVPLCQDCHKRWEGVPLRPKLEN